MKNFYLTFEQKDHACLKMQIKDCQETRNPVKSHLRKCQLTASLLIPLFKAELTA